jgi:hypothetical protein
MNHGKLTGICAHYAWLNGCSRPSESQYKHHIALQQNTDWKRPGWSSFGKRRRSAMTTTGSSIAPFQPSAAGPASGLIGRLIEVLLASHVRLYVAAITDPATGRADPELERSVARMMMGL